MKPLSEAQRAIYAVLAGAAQAGDPCPDNETIAERVGGTATKSGVSAHIHQMKVKGWIEVEWSVPGARRVTILETGERTAESVRPEPRCTAATNREAEALRRAVPAPPVHDPCWHCGTHPKSAAQFGCARCRDGQPALPAIPAQYYRRRSMVR